MCLYHVFFSGERIVSSYIRCNAGEAHQLDKMHLYVCMVYCAVVVRAFSTIHNADKLYKELSSIRQHLESLSSQNQDSGGEWIVRAKCFKLNRTVVKSKR